EGETKITIRWSAWILDEGRENAVRHTKTLQARNLFRVARNQRDDGRGRLVNWVAEGIQRNFDGSSFCQEPRLKAFRGGQEIHGFQGRICQRQREGSISVEQAAFPFNLLLRVGAA